MLHARSKLCCMQSRWQVSLPERRLCGADVSICITNWYAHLHACTHVHPCAPTCTQAHRHTPGMPSCDVSPACGMPSCDVPQSAACHPVSCPQPAKSSLSQSVNTLFTDCDSELFNGRSSLIVEHNLLDAHCHCGKCDGQEGFEFALKACQCSCPHTCLCVSWSVHMLVQKSTSTSTNMSICLPIRLASQQLMHTSTFMLMLMMSEGSQHAQHVHGLGQALQHR